MNIIEFILSMTVLSAWVFALGTCPRITFLSTLLIAFLSMFGIITFDNNTYETQYSRELIRMDVKAVAENKGISETFDNNFDRPNINNFSNKITDNASQQGSQNIYTYEKKQDLAKAASEIQQLLKQLERSNPTATESKQVAYVYDNTTPSFKRRVIGALQAGGEAAIEEFLDNSYVNMVKAIVKGWIEP